MIDYMPVKEVLQPSVEDYLEPDEVVIPINDWHRLVALCISIYFVLCLSTAYFGYQTLFVDKAVIENWRVSYCRQYVQLVAAEQPSQQAYLNEDLSGCQTTKTK